jgi:hypothetical protein
MGTLKRFTKRPGETIDYDITFVEWLAKRADTVSTFSVATDAGITKVAEEHASGVVKVYLSGGTAGRTYKVTATITTVLGRIKQGQITVRVRG